MTEQPAKPPLYTVEPWCEGWAILYQGRPIGEWFKRKSDATRRFNFAYASYNEKHDGDHAANCAYQNFVRKART